MPQNVFAGGLESEEAHSGAGYYLSDGIQLEIHQYVSCSLVYLWVTKRENAIKTIAMW